jgi:hypothetical protein
MGGFTGNLRRPLGTYLSVQTYCMFIHDFTGLPPCVAGLK